MSLNDYAIIDTTLREGEQFVTADFTTSQRMEIARALDAFGVEYIEVTSPQASPQSRRDLQRLVRMGLRAKILTNIRCHIDDVNAALDTGVQGINLFIGTSFFSRTYGHGKDIDQIIDLATSVITYLHEQAPDVEIRFSTEDSFRSTLQEVLRVDLAVDHLGMVKRFGVADTVGVATPHQVYDLVKNLRLLTSAEIEFHGHNDAGCAIANAHAALEAGGTHIDTTVLGLGERNGLTSLEGFIARMYATDRETVMRKYRLELLPELSQMVARAIGQEIPFNHCITGAAAFTHKAGIHTNGILRNPKIYEPIDPTDFGLSRSIMIAHKLTGWNAIQDRANQLGLRFDRDQVRAVTQHIKSVADLHRLTLAEVDDILRAWAEPGATGILEAALPR